MNLENTVFETLPKARGYTSHQKSVVKVWTCVKYKSHNDNDENSKFWVELPLEDSKFVSFPEQDPNIWELWDKIKGGMYNDFYLVKNDVLFKCIVDNGQEFEARVIPHSLVDVVLHLCHKSIWTQWIPEDLCSNQAFILWGSSENTDSTILQMPVMFVHNKRYKKTQFEKKMFEPGLQPMEFISMDLVGEFHPPSSKGNRYTLTDVCMLTGYTFCISI